MRHLREVLPIVVKWVLLTLSPAWAAGPVGSTVFTYTGPLPRMTKPNPTGSLIIWWIEILKWIGQRMLRSEHINCFIKFLYRIIILTRIYFLTYGAFSASSSSAVAILCNNARNVKDKITLKNKCMNWYSATSSHFHNHLSFFFCTKHTTLTWSVRNLHIFHLACCLS